MTENDHIDIGQEYLHNTGIVSWQTWILDSVFIISCIPYAIKNSIKLNIALLNLIYVFKEPLKENYLYFMNIWIKTKLNLKLPTSWPLYDKFTHDRCF